MTLPNKELFQFYCRSTYKMPPDGRYTVLMCLDKVNWAPVLEKTLSRGRGANHLPFFALRHIAIPRMGFQISDDGEEIVFRYTDVPITDHLGYIEEKGRWLGKLMYKGRFVDWFYLVPKNFATEGTENTEKNK